METQTVAEPVAAGQPAAPSAYEKLKRLLGPIGVVVAFLALKGKTVLTFLYPIVKLLKLGKVMTTGGTMLLSIWFYSLLYGWWLAVGFVITILIHEMGHVYMAWRRGLPVSAPMFIPGFGALIMLKKQVRSTWEDAIIGIGGPIFGAAAGLASWGIYSLTGNGLFLAVAYITFFINLFNMAPIYPLDGGRIVGAVSPWLWAVGLVLMVVLFFSGFLRNPFILLLVILSLPTMWTAFKGRGADPYGAPPLPLARKAQMGLAYISLAGFLVWAMGVTHVEGERLHSPPAAQVAQR